MADMQTIERIVALVPFGPDDTKVVWQGIHSHIEHRSNYKALSLQISVPTADVEKWLALLACIAASAGLTVYLSGLAFGPVGWVGVAAAILAAAFVCFSQISPDTFKQANGSANVIHHTGDWHRV